MQRPAPAADSDVRLAAATARMQRLLAQIKTDSVSGPPGAERHLAPRAGRNSSAPASAVDIPTIPAAQKHVSAASVPRAATVVQAYAAPSTLSIASSSTQTLVDASFSSASALDVETIASWPLEFGEIPAPPTDTVLGPGGTDETTLRVITNTAASSQTKLRRRQTRRKQERASAGKICQPVTSANKARIFKGSEIDRSDSESCSGSDSDFSDVAEAEMVMSSRRSSRSSRNAEPAHLMIGRPHSLMSSTSSVTESSAGSSGRQRRSFRVQSTSSTSRVGRSRLSSTSYTSQSRSRSRSRSRRRKRYSRRRPRPTEIVVHVPLNGHTFGFVSAASVAVREAATKKTAEFAPVATEPTVSVPPIMGKGGVAEDCTGAISWWKRVLGNRRRRGDVWEKRGKGVGVWVGKDATSGNQTRKDSTSQNRASASWAYTDPTATEEEVIEQHVSRITQNHPGEAISNADLSREQKQKKELLLRKVSSSFRRLFEQSNHGKGAETVGDFENFDSQGKLDAISATSSQRPATGRKILQRTVSSITSPTIPISRADITVVRNMSFTSPAAKQAGARFFSAPEVSNSTSNGVNSQSSVAAKLPNHWRWSTSTQESKASGAQPRSFSVRKSSTASAIQNSDGDISYIGRKWTDGMAANSRLIVRDGSRPGGWWGGGQTQESRGGTATTHLPPTPAAAASWLLSRFDTISLSGARESLSWAHTQREYLFADSVSANYRTLSVHEHDPDRIAADAQDAARDVAAGGENRNGNGDDGADNADDGREAKRAKAAEADNGGSGRRGRAHAAERAAARVQNRTGGVAEHAFGLCFALAETGECVYGAQCKLSHDIDGYLASAKPPDIGARCVIFEKYGRCRFGARCRFAHAHRNPATGQFNLVDEEKASKAVESGVVMSLNQVFKKDLIAAQKEFKKAGNGLKYEKVNEYQEWSVKVKEFNGYKAQLARTAAQARKEALDGGNNHGSSEHTAVDSVNKNGFAKDKSDFEESFNDAMKYLSEDARAKFDLKTKELADYEDVFESKGRDVDRKPFEWKGTYLAPLTNVGNLPFRRVAKDFGVDITCAEMAMCQGLTSFNLQEWALLRRHPTEKKFGIQIAASKGIDAAKAGEVINKLLFESPTNGSHALGLAPFDFVDINCGCPIDLVFNSGAGSAVLGNRTRMRDIIYALRHTLPVPVTAKLRTGISAGSPVAHKLIPAVAGWGASAVTLHGRSRQQRYTRHADWDYINECARVARASGLPFFGNGDVLGFEDYYAHMPSDGAVDANGVDGIMVGRGALVKPWIFTEINERQVILIDSKWDISGRERFEIFQKFADYGLEHWGTDTKGVNTTRQYLLDWMSFTYRYIPVGLLDVLPQKFNERAPAFYGRDYFETLLASPRVEDWIYVTEKILGKAPQDFHFIPKHKSNSYEGDDSTDNVHG
ncbi:tRNA-dihydrouridine(47) synthase [NAD(P)(+)]-like protein [Entophlyctis luteolus]|nr:tRNA-dihydrouridine(47) synthase [NAD(P)(+)]-like protein [Entophlyctis luteolus]